MGAAVPGFYRTKSAGGSGGSINFDFTTGSLPAGITFTRPSIGTYNSSGNILTTASSNAARFNYVAGVANLLIEGSATNLLTQSNNFTSADWLPQGGATVSANQFISPDGTNNGSSLISNTLNGYIIELFTFAAVPYTLSVWAKQITGVTYPQLIISSATSGAIASVSTTISRVSFTATPPVGANGSLIQVVAAVGTEGIFGAQLETGSKMTSYIPTTTAAVTRAADSAVFTVPSGVGHLTYTFDDNSTQLVSVSAGSYTIPVTLNRPNIKSIVGSA